MRIKHILTMAAFSVLASAANAGQAPATTSAATNVSAAQVAETGVVSQWEGLPLELALKRVQGAGEREVVIFSDPNCGYCKRLESVLASIDNLTVYTFIFPFLSDDSREKTSGILCSANPSAAWSGWMLQGKAPGANTANTQCAAKTQELLATGRRFNIQGTPVLFFGDGSRLNGFSPVDVIERKLKQASIKR